MTLRLPSPVCRWNPPGKPAPGGTAPGLPVGWLAGFTLIELILVMAVLATVLAVAAPSLSRFFQGRKVEEEAMRFLALTRYAQSRAVAEGVPMLLWIDTGAGRYGLQAEWTWQEADPRALEYAMDPSVRAEVEPAAVTRSPADLSAAAWAQVFRTLEGQTTPDRYVLRFTPDGLPGPLSPERIRFVQETDTGETVAVVRRNRNRLAYELETYEVPDAQR
ncbi:pilus assembly FimT family protein [Limisphaera sp. 4302-co]